jgi:hypothetical protein
LFGNKIVEAQTEVDQLKDKYVNHHHPENMSSFVDRASFIDSACFLNRVEGFVFVYSIKAFSRAISV